MIVAGWADAATARIVEPLTAQEQRWLEGALSHEVYNHARGETEVVCLYSRKTQTFPRGLCRTLAKRAARDGVGFELDAAARLLEKRLRALLEPEPDLAWLRSYQKDAAQAWAAKGGGIVKSPTGSGKSELIVAAHRMLPTVRWLFAVHRSSLVGQAADRFKLRTGVKPGLLKSGTITNPNAPIVFTTFQTLDRLLKQRGGREVLQSFTGLIVDECHATASPSYAGVTAACTNAWWRLGISATPLDRAPHENMITVGALGPIVATVNTQQLIEAGVLSRPTIHFASYTHPHMQGVDWREVYNAGIVHSRGRNMTVVDLVQRARKPSLCFFKQLEHARHLSALMRERGITHDIVDGSDMPEVRERKIKRLMRGEVEVLLSSVVLQDGVDIPDLASVVNAAAGLSVVALLQKTGRGMRAGTDGTKLEFELWDVLDNGQKWLSQHARGRIATLKEQGHDVHISGVPRAFNLYDPTPLDTDEGNDEVGT